MTTIFLQVLKQLLAMQMEKEWQKSWIGGMEVMCERRYNKVRNVLRKQILSELTSKPKLLVKKEVRR